MTLFAGLVFYVGRSLVCRQRTVKNPTEILRQQDMDRCSTIRLTQSQQGYDLCCQLFCLVYCLLNFVFIFVDNFWCKCQCHLWIY